MTTLLTMIQTELENLEYQMDKVEMNLPSVEWRKSLSKEERNCLFTEELWGQESVRKRLGYLMNQWLDLRKKELKLQTRMENGSSDATAN